MTAIDFTILNWIQQHCTNWYLNHFFPTITVLGEAGIFWILLTVFFLLKKETRRMGICMAVALLLDVTLVNVVIKPLVARPRPFTEINAMIQASQLLVPIPSEFSFPSGHAAAAFAACFAMHHFEPKKSLFAYALAFLIAFSRLYLYVHFPTDVLAGMIIGTVCGILSVLLMKILFNRKADVYVFDPKNNL